MTVKKERLLLSLTLRDKENLEKLAKYYDRSMAGVVRVLIRREVKRITKKRRIVRRVKR